MSAHDNKEFNCTDNGRGMWYSPIHMLQHIPVWNMFKNCNILNNCNINIQTYYK